MPKPKKDADEGIEPDELMKAVQQLEADVKKGDPLQDAPHDGGLATEGKNIQSRDEAKKAIEAILAKGGYNKSQKARLLKMLSATDMESGDGDEPGDDDGDEGGGEDDEDEKPMPTAMKGKIKKGAIDSGVAQLAHATTGDLKKAIIDHDESNENVFDATPFLDGLVKSLGAQLADAKAGTAVLYKALLDDRATQKQFRGTLAKAFSLLDEKLTDISDRIQKIENQPVPNSRPTTVRKSDVVQPDFRNQGHAPGDEGGDNEPSPLYGVEYLKIQEALVDMVMKGEIQDSMNVTKFENAKGDLRVLDPKIVKALEKRLCAAA